MVFSAAKPCTLGLRTCTTSHLEMVSAAPAAAAESTKTSDDPLLLRTARGEEVERVPVWMMRQAGRHMQCYRDLPTDYKPFTIEKRYKGIHDCHYCTIYDTFGGEKCQYLQCNTLRLLTCSARLLCFMKVHNNRCISVLDRSPGLQAAIRNTRGVYRDLTAAIQPLQ
eukprot:17733-Heterococcus_DN1.PRE.3